MDENFNPDEVAPASYTPDEIDRKIIDLLMQNARMPVKEIAKQLYLTSPTVSEQPVVTDDTAIDTAVPVDPVDPAVPADPVVPVEPTVPDQPVIE